MNRLKKGEKPKKKKRGSTNQGRFMAKVMSGDILSRDMIIQNLPFLFYVTFLLICYIGYGYYVDRTARNINELETRKRELHSDYIDENMYWNTVSMFSQVADSTKSSGLLPSRVPPRKIIVTPSEYKVEETE